MEKLPIVIQDQVSPQARERFERPRNYGPLSEWNGHARITGPWGDTMEFWLDVRQGRIARLGFTTTGGGEALAREMDVPFLGRIPIDPEMVGCGDSGVPYVRLFSESPAAKAFAEAVRRILDKIESVEQPSVISRMEPER